MDMLDRLMAYERDELPHDEVLTLFQELLTTGMVWQLQGSYGRMAQHLIDMGYIITGDD